MSYRRRRHYLCDYRPYWDDCYRDRYYWGRGRRYYDYPYWDYYYHNNYWRY